MLGPLGLVAHRVTTPKSRPPASRQAALDGLVALLAGTDVGGYNGFTRPRATADIPLGVLAARIVQGVAEVVGDGSSLWLVADGDLELEPSYVGTWHPDRDRMAALHSVFITFPDPTGLVSSVIRTGEVAFFADFHPGLVGPRAVSAFAPVTARFATRSLMIVPLVAGGRAIGAMSAFRDAGHPAFTTADLDQLSDLASRVALALDNARLREAAARAEHARSASEQRYHTLVQHAADAILVAAPDGRIAFATPSARTTLGPAMDAGESLLDAVHPDDQRAVRAAFEAIVNGRRPDDVLEFRVERTDGTWRFVEGTIANLLNEPSVAGIVVNVRDVTERRRVSEQQAAVAALGQWALTGGGLAELLEAATALVARTLDLPLCGVFELAATAEELRLVSGVGWAADEIGSITVPTGVHGLSDYELTWLHPVTVGDLDGSTRFLGGSLFADQGAASGVTVTIEGGAHPYGVLSAFSTLRRTFSQADVNFLVAVANVIAAVVERSRTEQEVRHRALHDVLTGLPNRTLLADRLAHALASAARDGRSVGLLLLDLDGFKDVNDSLGHHAGDELLRQVADRLRSRLRASDTVARLGGDEFAVCLPDLHMASEASALAGKLLDALEEPFPLAEMAVSLSASIGVAFSGEHGSDASVLLQRADIAMYRAKRARAGWAVYDTATDEAHRHRLSVLSDLRDAADLGELDLHYHPLVDLRTGQVRHVEALVRWSRPGRGQIAPADFVPLAEQSGLIHPLSTWVVRTAITQAAAWAEAGIDLTVAVNLSGSVLQDENLPRAVTAALADAGLAPDRLVVEITESVIASEDVRLGLQRLAEEGVRCSIDDFGTGYSSLASLKSLPVRQLKIDQAFVTDMATDRRDAAIVTSIIELAHSLDLAVIAEGVETAEVAARLAALGADYAQGFVFCRPLPVDELEAWLTAPPVVVLDRSLDLGVHGSGTIVG